MYLRSGSLAGCFKLSFELRCQGGMLNCKLSLNVALILAVMTVMSFSLLASRGVLHLAVDLSLRSGHLPTVQQEDDASDPSSVGFCLKCLRLRASILCTSFSRQPSTLSRSVCCTLCSSIKQVTSSLLHQLVLRLKPKCLRWARNSIFSLASLLRGLVCLVFWVP